MPQRAITITTGCGAGVGRSLVGNVRVCVCAFVCVRVYVRGPVCARVCDSVFVCVSTRACDFYTVQCVMRKGGRTAALYCVVIDFKRFDKV